LIDGLISVIWAATAVVPLLVATAGRRTKAGISRVELRRVDGGESAG